MLLLMGLSVWSISIMLDRRKFYRKIHEEKTFESLELLRKRDWAGLKKRVADAHSNEEVAIRQGVLHVAMEIDGADSEKVERAVRSYVADQRPALEKGFNVLATLGSNAPFIGLLGTVLGIIEAFGALSARQSDTASVMSGISEALVATGIGLFVAIPAVIGYNYFSWRLKTLLAECESIKDLYLSKI